METHFMFRTVSLVFLFHKMRISAPRFFRVGFSWKKFLISFSWANLKQCPVRQNNILCRKCNFLALYKRFPVIETTMERFSIRWRTSSFYLFVLWNNTTLILLKVYWVHKSYYGRNINILKKFWHCEFSCKTKECLEEDQENRLPYSHSNWVCYSTLLIAEPVWSV